MKLKSMKVLEKLFDRAAGEESVKNHLCFLKIQLAELKGKRSYVTVSLHRTKIMPTCREGR
ncbi:uncharacterized protein DS421_13g421710 [Arachis hypogaea]|nr:uncharacterized protein DS421_13g421710 [Arachis hypogaea]